MSALDGRKLARQRAEELNVAIRAAGIAAEAKRCNDRNGAERAAAKTETPEQIIARYTAEWSPCRISPTLRASLNLPDPDQSSMEQAS